MQTLTAISQALLPDSQPEVATPFVGLAPFLRMSIAGEDFFELAQSLLKRAEKRPEDANLWMNLSIIMLSLQQTELGLAMQSHALSLQQLYTLHANQQPTKLRLLMLMLPGILSTNVPLDCILENSDIELQYYYIVPDAPFKTPIPQHDLMMIAISATDENTFLLQQLETLIPDWPTPVLNLPQHVPNSERMAASALLQDKPGIQMAQAYAISRQTLTALAKGETTLQQVAPGCQLPIILRPNGSHGGHGLEKIAHIGDVKAYLKRVQAENYFISQFIDYSNEDGQFRKYRISLVDGQPFGCHMAISSDWMVHYVNAQMYENPAKRAEEGKFLANFSDFAKRHKQAFDAIHQSMKLDYLGIDCSETRDGKLLVFEVDPAMVIHAMDQEALFPHKQIHMQKVKTALHQLLLRRAATADSHSPINGQQG
jgi:hypothetical protein